MKIDFDGDVSRREAKGVRVSRVGMAVNGTLAVVKLVAGIAGHSYALIADAVESLGDIVSSMIVWGGLVIAAKPADENHPYGHGKAEPLAALGVALMLIGAAVGIAVAAVSEIKVPHHATAPFPRRFSWSWSASPTRCFATARAWPPPSLPLH